MQQRARYFATIITARFIYRKKKEDVTNLSRIYCGTAQSDHLIGRMRLSWHWPGHVTYLCHHGWVIGTIGLAWQ
jgi:hypothetical protein